MVKIFDAELRMMRYIWDRAPVRASDLVPLCRAELGWKHNTTYTVLKRLVERGAIQREDPGFVVTPLVSRDEVAEAEAGELIQKLYDGSRSLFLAGLLSSEKLSRTEMEELRALIDQHEGESK